MTINLPTYDEALNDKDHTANAKLRKSIEKALRAGNNGIISRLGTIPQLLYPSYSQEKGISDILNNRDTADAALLFALSTKDNKSEIYISSQESVLSQLYAPISMNRDIMEHMTEDVLSDYECSLIFCIKNLTFSYNNICQRYKVERQELCPLSPSEQYPFINPAALLRIRKQTFKCLLSIKDITPVIRDQFLKELDDNVKLIGISDSIKDLELQLFLMSFVELNIDIEAWETITLSLLRAFRNGDLEPLAKHLNAVVKRLSEACIEHDLPIYTKDNLPPIKFSTYLI